MMVPAHAVHVSVSVPVLVSGPQIPCFKFTCQAERKQSLHNQFSELASNLVCSRPWTKKSVSCEKVQVQKRVRGKRWRGKWKYEIWAQVVLKSKLSHLHEPGAASIYILVQNGFRLFKLYLKTRRLAKNETMHDEPSRPRVCMRMCVCVSHSWIRQATACVERR